jgi:hypothetical protein
LTANFQAALYDIANRPVSNIANRAVYLCIRVIVMKKISTSRLPYGAFFVSANCGSMAQGQVPALFHIQLKEKMQ